MDARELYRLPPEAFTAARDAEAARRRADGDRDGARTLTALRRPSVGAWLVNLLAQDSADLLGQLLELGPALAHAQSGGDAASLRALGAQRRELVEAVTTTAVQAAGRSVTAAVRDEVAATLEAALADPASAQAVRSGRLVRALSYAGFGDVDLSDAVAGERPAGSGTPGKTRKGNKGPKGSSAHEAARAREQERARRVAAAQAAAHNAAGRLDDAVRACEQAERVRAAAQSAADERAADVDRIAEELARARAGHDRAAHEAHEARLAADSALAQVRRAQDAAEGAREELDRLRRE